MSSQRFAFKQVAPRYPEWVFPTFAFIGFVLCMIPIRWHMRAWNIGTLVFMIWIGFACLFLGINSIIWKDNVRNVSTFWAYFTSRFIYAASWGANVASFIISHRLYRISRVDAVMTTEQEKRRQITIDVALGVLIPIIGVVLQYVNSCNSYDIYEELGPFTVARVTYVWLVTIIIPPILITFVAGIYATLALIAFNKRRSQFQQILASNSGLTTHRYLRIMGLCVGEILLMTPLAIYRGAWVIKAVGFEPYISWDHIHNNYSDIDIFPSSLWRASPTARMLDLNRWIYVVASILFFGFFGFAEEARKQYASAFGSVLKLAGRTRSTLIGSRSGKSTGATSTLNGSSMGKTGTLPVFVHKETPAKRDSFDSISDISDADILDEKQISTTIHTSSTHTLNDRPASPISLPPLPDFPVDEKSNAHNMA